MKNVFQKCDTCNDITIHSIKKVQSQRGLRREVDKCNQCGRTTIKNRKSGSRTISGKNEKEEIEDA